MKPFLVLALLLAIVTGALFLGKRPLNYVAGAPEVIRDPACVRPDGKIRAYAMSLRLTALSWLRRSLRVKSSLISFSAPIEHPGQTQEATLRVAIINRITTQVFRITCRTGGGSPALLLDEAKHGWGSLTEWHNFDLPPACWKSGRLEIDFDYGRRLSPGDFSIRSPIVKVLEAAEGLDEPNPHGLEAYANADAYNPGDSATLFVHAPKRHFDVSLVPIGGDEAPIVVKKNVAGLQQRIPTLAYRDGAKWQLSTVVALPRSLRSGLYRFELNDGSTVFNVPIIIRGSAPTPIAVLSATNTWQAYNNWGGTSLYRSKFKECLDRYNSTIVSFLRPKTGGEPLSRTGRGAYHLTAGEVPLLRWLRGEKYPHVLITDKDLHVNANVLDSHSVFILNTHPEYWTRPMLAALKRFLARGGNLMYLGGNGVYGIVTLANDQIELHYNAQQHAHTGEKGGYWPEKDQYETLGVAYSAAGIDTFAPYQVVAPEHWVFAGTGLQKGDLFSFDRVDNRFHGSGGETDKVGAGSPKGLVVLARGTNPNGGGGDMVLWRHPGGGSVFSTGSISFPATVAGDAHSRAVVKNILERFLREAPRVTPGIRTARGPARGHHQP